jgi:hypothetical protein
MVNIWLMISNTRIGKIKREYPVHANDQVEFEGHNYHVVHSMPVSDDFEIVEVESVKEVRSSILH